MQSAYPPKKEKKKNILSYILNVKQRAKILGLGSSVQDS